MSKAALTQEQFLAIYKEFKEVFKHKYGGELEEVGANGHILFHHLGAGITVDSLVKALHPVSGKLKDAVSWKVRPTPPKPQTEENPRLNHSKTETPEQQQFQSKRTEVEAKLQIGIVEKAMTICEGFGSGLTHSAANRGQQTLLAFWQDLVKASGVTLENLAKLRAREDRLWDGK